MADRGEGEQRHVPVWTHAVPLRHENVGNPAAPPCGVGDGRAWQIRAATGPSFTRRPRRGRERQGDGGRRGVEGGLERSVREAQRNGVMNRMAQPAGRGSRRWVGRALPSPRPSVHG